MTGETKQCHTCGEVKLLSEFNRNKASKDGHVGECKACRSASNKVRYIGLIATEKVIPETKRCSKCNEVKPLSEFHRNKANKDGHRGECKACQNVVNNVRTARIAATEKVIPETKRCSKCGIVKDKAAYGRNSNAKDGLTFWCKECCSASKLESDVVFSSRLKQQHNGDYIPRAEFDRRLAENNGVCPLCGKPNNGLTAHGTPKRLAMDYNHKTSFWRAPLCNGCNLRMAAIDNDEFLANALRYKHKWDHTEQLEKWESEPAALWMSSELSFVWPA